MKKLFVLACLLASISCYSQTEGEVYKVVEVLPRFPSSCEEDSTLSDPQKKRCGDREMLKFVYGNLKYPIESKNQGVSGTVEVTFTIDKEGFMQNPEIVRSPDPLLKAAAMTLIEKMKSEIQWIPGLQDGKPVAVKFNLPIRFRQ